jgi:NTE family protein
MTEPRLGLALSGGGFRAAFFHLGALRRLAELNLLRHVTTLSTVSGGSVLAALYFLEFKHSFEKNNGVLTIADYVAIIDEVERKFVKGSRADLRNRLFMSVGSHCRALLFGHSYGHTMAALYARYFYGGVAPLHGNIVELPGEPPPLERSKDPEAVRKRFPSSGYPGRPREKRGELLHDFNARTTANIPRLVFNSTCLNTGGRFTFMLNEMGGPNVGYVRTDEVIMLLQYKTMLRLIGNDPFERRALSGRRPRGDC